MEEQKANGRGEDGLQEELRLRSLLGPNFGTQQTRTTDAPPIRQRRQEPSWTEIVFGRREPFGSIRSEPDWRSKYEAKEADRTPAGLVDGFDKICQLWNLDAYQRASLLGLANSVNLSNQIISGQVKPDSRDPTDRMAYVLSISLGLAELFDSNRKAECDWLMKKRAELSENTPLEHMLEGSMHNILDVVAMVLSARGLD